MNLIKFTVLDNDSPAVPDPFEVHINPNKIVGVRPKNENRSILHLDISGPLKMIDVEGGFKETLKKLD